MTLLLTLLGLIAATWIAAGVALRWLLSVKLRRLEAAVASLDQAIAGTSAPIGRLNNSVSAIEQRFNTDTFKGRFQPTADRLRDITETGARLLNEATSDKLDCFFEHVPKATDVQSETMQKDQRHMR